jgi:hypothetical protein
VSCVDGWRELAGKSEGSELFRPRNILGRDGRQALLASRVPVNASASLAAQKNQFATACSLRKESIRDCLLHSASRPIRLKEAELSVAARSRSADSRLELEDPGRGLHGLSPALDQPGLGEVGDCALDVAHPEAVAELAGEGERVEAARMDVEEVAEDGLLGGPDGSTRAIAGRGPGTYGGRVKAWHRYLLLIAGSDGPVCSLWPLHVPC